MGDSRLTVNMRRFDEFIRESGLLDPPLRNAAFTWSNMQVDPICKRLDRFLFSAEWDSFFSQNIQEALPRWTSDHSPICLETNPFMWGPTPFRFENMWLLHPEFKEKFRDWWQECSVEGWEGHKFMRKLKFIKSKLKEWNTRVFGDLRERKKHILTDLGRIDRIEQEGNLNLELVSERILRRKELEDLLLKEEVQWRQKSRVKWIKEGDCNSKFFHRVATGRRSRKYIKSLISERGETLNNIEVISEEIVNFFGNLYSKPEGDSWKIEGIDWAPISEESAIWLDRPFSEEEVRMAVFQLNKAEKAPGPDGFTLAIYQECWDVIKEDLMRVFFEFHTKGVINQSTNATFIAMVPKKSQTFKISDYRPISLVTSLYKIIAKVLSGRLRKVLHETIFGSQGAFVEGRQILDAVLIANEVVDEKRRSGEEGVVFKIDFEKAYDHVEWGFLDHVLQRKGFSQKWRAWMRGCLSSSSFAILVNGNAKGWVKASRGLRQGDPLSPFLFTLVADVLSRLMIRAEEAGITEGFLVGRDRTRVSLLQFADDTIFFSKASLDLLQNLKIILLVFGQVSGLKINLEKSTISGINTRQEMLSSLALVLECRVSEWPLSYLGLPLGGNPKTIGFWDPVVERISRRLDGWKKAYLSLGGRITLIQSCLSHIPSYFLSLFKIPVSIASKIEKMQRDFLWSGAGEGKRDHLIRWEVVSRPREMGGLGFGKTSMRNSALLGKWLWRFPRERSGLWHKVIASIYGTHPNGWDANMVVRWSHRCPWKAIAQVFQKFSPFVRLVVGNGERIRFWEDLWWGNQTLCAQFAELYRVSSVRNLTVSNVLGNSFPLSWNFNFRRNLTDSEIDLFQRLMSSLHSVLLSPSSSDSRAWSLSSSGSFSVKSFFYALSKDSNPLMFLPAKFLWSSKVPSKVKALAWLVAHGKVNTNDKLQLRRPYKALCPQWCILCKRNGESIDHLFLHCPVTIGLWHRLFNLVGVIWVPPRSIEDMLVISFRGLGNSKPGGIIALLDEACMFPRSTHETFSQKLYQTFKSHKRFSKPKLSPTDFTIYHYAGDVTYQTEHFLDKNKDYVVAEHQSLLSASRCSFVADLFPPLPEESSKTSKFSSIGSRFKQQLQSLLETLSATEPHYVRCVKPNNLLKPSIFENNNVLQQLRCGGVLEAIRISCAGFPTRRTFVEFIARFGILAPDVLKGSCDEVTTSKRILEKVDLKGYQIGKTKVFLRAGQMAELDARRNEVLGRSASIIQRKVRSYLSRKSFVLLRQSAIQIQASCRVQVACHRYEKMRKEAACRTIQKDLRMYLARKAYNRFCSSAVSIQTGMRAMGACNELRFRKQTKAAIIIQAAKETGALQAAKTMLEKQVEELTCQLQLEKRMRPCKSLDIRRGLGLSNKIFGKRMGPSGGRAKLNDLQEKSPEEADIEEAKTQENAKLQNALQEMQVQFQETKEMLIKERENAKKADEKVPIIQEVPAIDHEMMNKLTAENEKLKDLVSSLEKKIDETQRKYEETNKISEERLKQALDAESKIIQLKTDMQRLEEKLSDMETEDQILRQQVSLHSPVGKMSEHLAIASEEPESVTPVKKFGTESDNKLRKSQIERQHVRA
uniref:Myosin-6 n=1 Tax=Vitis vinifera TaxID=29760 RepID=A5AFR7_VITVI|nr:hypothetical protein VITISV_002943 [Vitis vinifera]